jgi:predicted metal-dependent phosphoesterase TrpH
VLANSGREASLSDKIKLEKRWLKADLHTHCNLDPIDYRICPDGPKELIAKAAKLRYEVLAITCHDLDIWTESLSEYALSYGITLIPGMEVTTEKTRQTLVYNFHTGPENLNTLSKIRARSREDTVVIAPHPFYPGRTCLRSLLERNLDLFDAIEYSGFHVRGLDFNRRSYELAAKYGKPLVGNGDVHYSWQLNRTFTWIYSEPGIRSVLSALKQGLVRVQKSPLAWSEAVGFWATTFWRYAFPVNSPPVFAPLDEIKDGRRFGTAQESMKPQRVHISQ